MKSKYVSVTIMLGLLFVFVATGICQEKTATNDWVEKVGQGSINWTAGYIEATGIGVPPDRSVSKINARPEALRVAKADAVRNLSELAKSVRVDSARTIRDFAVESDIINKQVNGLVQGAMVADQQYMPDGTVEVKLRIPLYGDLARTVLPAAIEKKISSVPPKAATAPPVKIPSAAVTPQAAPSAAAPPAPPAAAPSAATPTQTAATPPPAPVPSVYTGMVVDARGIQARPAISPRIFDEDGKEVYGFDNVEREYVLKQGLSSYVRDLTAAQSNQRVTTNPLTVKALKTSGTGKADLVISNVDAERIRASETNAAFMKQCRVMIVLD